MKVYYDKHNKRLIFAGKRATATFWDKHWDIYKVKQNIKSGKDDKFVLKTLEKYIPKNGYVLEGGCGLGSRVYCMHYHGYNAIGVDFAEKTIAYVKKVIPDLDVRKGDVRALDFPADYFTGYWSIGVIEHFWEGYLDIATEMHRVLKDNGYVFLAFPYMSPLRKLKSFLGLYSELPLNVQQCAFYQFALLDASVIKTFETLGFSLVEKKPLSGLKGLKDEITIFKPLLQKIYDYNGKRFLVKAFRIFLDKLLSLCGTGHILFIVFRNQK